MLFWSILCLDSSVDMVDCFRFSSDNFRFFSPTNDGQSSGEGRGSPHLSRGCTSQGPLSLEKDRGTWEPGCLHVMAQERERNWAIFLFTIFLFCLVYVVPEIYFSDLLQMYQFAWPALGDFSLFCHFLQEYFWQWHSTPPTKTQGSVSGWPKNSPREIASPAWIL